MTIILSTKQSQLLCSLLLEVAPENLEPDEHEFLWHLRDKLSTAVIAYAPEVLL